MSEERFHAGRMPWAALDVPADGNAQHHRALPFSLTAPAYRRDFIAKLHCGGPEVVAELDFDDRLVTADRHARGDAGDACLSQRRIEHACWEGRAQAAGNTEDAALRVRDILAPQDRFRIPLEFLAEAMVDGVDHRHRFG